MRHPTLAATLLAASVSAPAFGASDELCESLEGFVVQVMDARMAGTSRQKVVGMLDDETLQEIARGVYDAPREDMSGTGRADFLTGFRGYCSGMWEG